MRAAGIRRHHAQPEVRAASTARLASYIANMTDERREQLRVLGRANADRLRAQNAQLSPEKRAENGRKRSATVMAWCPPAYRDAYRRLTVSMRMRAADARQTILDQIVADERRRHEAMTPFERQLERLRNGAQLVAKPDLRTAGPDYTLGGVATGQL